MEVGVVINNLKTLIKIVTRINNRLYELAIEKRYNGGLIGLQLSGNFRGGFRIKKTTYRDPYKYIPMELDFTQRKGKPRGKR